MTLKITRKNIYMFCLTVWIVVSVFFGRTMIGDVIGTTAITFYSMGRILIYALLLCVVLCGRINRNETLVLMLVSIILILSAMNSGEVVLMGVMLFVVAAKGINSEEIMQTYLNTHIAIVVTTTILAVTHVIDMNVMSRGLIQRNSFGFSHPNGFGGEILTIIVCYVTKKWGKLSNLELVVCSAIGLILLQKADCRMASTVLILYTLCVLIIKNFYKYRVNVNLIGTVVKAIFVVLLAMTVLAIIWYSYKNMALRIIDSVLSYRLDAMHTIYEVQGIKLFGQKILDDTFVGIDNSYARVLLISGFIPFAILVIFSIAVCNEFTKRKELRYLLSFAAIMLSGFIENNFFRIENNYCFLIGGTYLLSHIYTKKIYVYDKNINREKI